MTITRTFYQSTGRLETEIDGEVSTEQISFTTAKPLTEADFMQKALKERYKRGMAVLLTDFSSKIITVGMEAERFLELGTIIKELE